jgi:hypothetical protein
VSLRLILPVFLFSGGGIAKDFIPERYKNWYVLYKYTYIYHYISILYILYIYYYQTIKPIKILEESFEHAWNCPPSKPSLGSAAAGSELHERMTDIATRYPAPCPHYQGSALVMLQEPANSYEHSGVLLFSAHWISLFKVTAKSVPTQPECWFTDLLWP